MFNSLLKQTIDMRMKNKVIAFGRQTHCYWPSNPMLLDTKLNAVKMDMQQIGYLIDKQLLNKVMRA